MSLKIHHKLTLLFGFIIAVNLVGLYIYLNENVKADTYTRIVNLLYKQTLLSRSYVEKYLEVSAKNPDWQGMAGVIGTDLGLRTTIIAQDGVVLGDSTLPLEAVKKLENHALRPEIQLALKRGTGDAVRYSATKKEDMVYHAVTFSKNGYSGLVRLAMPQPQIQIDAQRFTGVVGVSLLFVFLISLILSFVASSSFSRPIMEIAKVADKIARGDFSEKIHLRRKDVIGDLAKTLNQMADQVRTRMEEVALSKSRLEAVLLSMFEGVLVVGRKEEILLMNQSLKELLQINEYPVGKKALEVIRNINVQEIISRAMELNAGVVSAEVSFLFPNEKIVLIHSAPILFQGKTEGVVLVFHDITDLRRLENIRQEFVANVSHELRTPIASIKGYAETLLEGALEDKANARDFIEIIHTDSDRLARLIEDILDLSRIESGSLKMEVQPCVLLPIVERVLSGLQKSLTEKKISLKNTITQNLPRIMADDDRIAQVFLNLIDNAIKYTPAGGKITISAQEKEKFIQVDITDTGIGIAEEDQPRVFERFYRVDKARSRELGSTGLGLSIVKHIVQAHRGDVFVKSRLGQGSTFSFTVPRV